MPFAVREFQATPNPNALKFVLDEPVSDAPLSFLTPASAENHDLAKRLFAIAGVTGVLLLGDFITINKRESAKWPEIKRNVQHALLHT